MPPPIVLVDMSNLFFRSWFAHKNLSCEGKPTGILFGVLKTLHDLRENVSHRVVFVWDHGVPVAEAARPRNWREDVLKTYKATRQHDAEERALIFSQLPDVFHALELLGYSSVSVEGLEADDVIGVLSKTLSGDILIYSTDRDFYQLLEGDRVKVLVPKKENGKFRTISQAEVEAEYGIGVDRWAEYLALGGDHSDNIKPMRGMGPKTAIKLICEGADLRKIPSGFSDQPRSFQLHHLNLEPVWLSVQASYYAAQIPTSWKDPRIRECIEIRGVPQFRVFPWWSPRFPMAEAQKDACES